MPLIHKNDMAETIIPDSDLQDISGLRAQIIGKLLPYTPLLQGPTDLRNGLENAPIADRISGEAIGRLQIVMHCDNEHGMWKASLIMKDSTFPGQGSINIYATGGGKSRCYCTIDALTRLLRATERKVARVPYEQGCQVR